MQHDKRDRDGEIFQNDVTENTAAHPPAREQAAHRLHPDGANMPDDADRTNAAFAEELKRTGHASGHE